MNRPGWSVVLLAGFVGAAVSAGVTWLLADVMLATPTGPAPALAPAAEAARPSDPDGSAARIAALEREIASLRAARAPRPRAAPPPAATAAGPRGDAPDRAVPAKVRGEVPVVLPFGTSIRLGEESPLTVSADDARHAAERYAAVVRAGGDGAAWLPLAIAGPADDPSPLRGIVDLIRDRNVPADARARALDALAATPHDLGTAPQDVLASADDPELRGAALRAILASVRRGAAVPEAVRALVTDREAPAELRDLALTIVAASDPGSALPFVSALVTSADPAERERGLNILMAQRDREFLPLMTRAAQRDDLGDRIGGLTEAIADTKDRKWSALQITGEPDTPAAGDFGTAWAAKAEQMGRVTIDLTFPHAVRPEGLRIRETLAAGGVASVAAETSPGVWEILWEGADASAPAPRWFEPQLLNTSAAVNRVRIVVDTDRQLGWEEIDAVELIGAGTRQWASLATASSSYAD